jgi:hypothetical protein
MVASTDTADGPPIELTGKEHRDQLFHRKGWRAGKQFDTVQIKMTSCGRTDSARDDRVDLMREQIPDTRLTVTLRGQDDRVLAEHALRGVILFEHHELSGTAEVREQFLVLNGYGNVSHREKGPEDTEPRGKRADAMTEQNTPAPTH